MTTSRLSRIIVNLTFHAVVLGGIGRAAEAVTKPPADLFPTDARRWLQNPSAIMMTDLSQAEPASALIKGLRQKGKWKALPYATAEWEGWALSCFSGTGAPQVSVPLRVKGWHAIYIGLATTSNPIVPTANGLKAKLSSEPGKKYSR